MSVSNAELRRTLDATCISVKAKYASCTSAAKNLASAYAKLLRAEETREIKNSAKAINAYARAESAFRLYKTEYLACFKHYEDLVEEVTRLYSRLIELEKNPKAAKKLHSELAKFDAKDGDRRDALSKRVCDIDLTPEEPITVRPEKKEESAPVSSESARRETESVRSGVPFYPPYDPYRPSYPLNVAPASIDISGIVEDSVRAAMNKFVAVFEKRMDEYESALGEFEMPESQAQSAPVSPKAEVICDMESALLDEEERILEKLAEIAGRLRELSESILSVGASAIEIAGAQRDGAEEQKRINEMQRRTARDIQGVIVNQKLIAAEAAELAGAQAAQIEEQKANIENQKLINQSQAEIREMEKSIIEAEQAINDTVRELIAQQKSAIAQQSSIISQGQKNIQAQRELSARQAEVNELQKAALKEQKSVSRDLRKISSKSKSNGETPKELVDAAEEILAAPISDEVDLDTIKVEE